MAAMRASSPLFTPSAWMNATSVMPMKAKILRR